jgi:hypothetical protein
MPLDEAQAALSATECRAQASKCRALVSHAKTEPQRIMLAHIAETWERIAADTAEQ